MNNEDYVSYELAKKLKECGFAEPCDHYYTKEDAPDGTAWIVPTTDREDFNADSDCPFCKPPCSAPTLAHAQKWLREKWGIYAYCEPNGLKKWFARAIDLAKNEDLLFDGEMFDNFEKAFEYAISAALELIKKGE